MELVTKSGHEFILNFNNKFPVLVMTQEAKALYANCSDIIPKVDEIKIINVGREYVNPVITIGTGTKRREIGTLTKDSNGRLIKADLTESILGFVKPEVEDLGTSGQEPTGNGGRLSVIYDFTSPREIRENNLLPLTQYIDCVGHPMIKSMKEDEEGLV